MLILIRSLDLFDILSILINVWLLYHMAYSISSCQLNIETKLGAIELQYNEYDVEAPNPYHKRQLYEK